MTSEEERNSILECLAFVKQGIEEDDKDMVKSYFEQLNDLVIAYLD